jgi:hypothetical protein
MTICGIAIRSTSKSAVGASAGKRQLSVAWNPRNERMFLGRGAHLAFHLLDAHERRLWHPAFSTDARTLGRNQGHHRIGISHEPPSSQTAQSARTSLVRFRIPSCTPTSHSDVCLHRAIVCPPPGYAYAELVSGMTTRLTLVTPHFRKWAPGQHFFIMIPSITPFTSHPFTCRLGAVMNPFCHCRLGLKYGRRLGGRACSRPRRSGLTEAAAGASALSSFAAASRCGVVVAFGTEPRSQ